MNSVRLPWANETLERNPLVPDYAVKANPQFKGKHAMEVMDAVVHALAEAHIMVILDNHVSRADWCCNDTDGNGLWYNAEYPESQWLTDWQTIVRRYKSERWVVGADLRNELRNHAAWGGTDPKLDWHAAAERGGNAVLAANPLLLIMVEGPEYSTNFLGFDKLPVRLNVADRLVYSPHAYNIANHRFASYEELKQALRRTRRIFAAYRAGRSPVGGRVWHLPNIDCGANSDWFVMYIRYMKENDLGWSYWALNGAQSSGASRKYDSIEDYGLLSPDYQHIAAPKLVELLRTVQN